MMGLSWFRGFEVQNKLYYAGRPPLSYNQASPVCTFDSRVATPLAKPVPPQILNLDAALVSVGGGNLRTGLQLVLQGLQQSVDVCAARRVAHQADAPDLTG